MTNEPTMSNEFHKWMFRYTALGVAGIWGVAMIVASLTGAFAQDSPAQPAEQPAQPAEQPAQPEQPAAQPEQAAAGARIAFVNMETVIRLTPRWWKSFNQIKARKEGNERELQEEHQELKNLEAEIKSGADIPADKFQEYAERANNFEINKQRLQYEIEKEMRELSKDVYLDVYNEIEAFSKGKYDIVLGIQDREIKTGTQAEFFQKITVRGVIVHNSTNDLTEEVITRLEQNAIDNGMATLEEINAYRKELGLEDSKAKAKSAGNNEGNNSGN